MNELLTNGDLAMHHSKYISKNIFSFYDNNIKEIYEQKNLLRNIFSSIFKNKKIEEHFYIVYQPIFSLMEDKISYVEVLTRFKHSQIKSEPSIFIPLIEEMNLIEELGYYIIERCFDDYKDLKNYSIIKLSINLSVKQLNNINFYKHIKQLINNFSILSQNIVFEITETSFMKEPQKALKTINSLSDLGFFFALDDFGTGYSSLQYLKEIPLKIIKIDKTLIQDIATHRKSLIILESLVNLFKSLNLEVIAEGVQDIHTFRILKDLSFDYVQGFLISPPLEKENLIKLIEKNSYKI